MVIWFGPPTRIVKGYADTDSYYFIPRLLSYPSMTYVSNDPYCLIL